MSNTKHEDRWFEIVKRTADVGLSESAADPTKKRMWLAIWALDVVNETLEAELADGKKAATEYGDVLWGIAASAMLLGVGQKKFVDGASSVDVGISSVGKLRHWAVAYSDLAKKTARDDRAETTDLIFSLQLLYAAMKAKGIDFDECLYLVDEKLKKRYKNGYSPAESINRAA